MLLFDRLRNDRNRSRLGDAATHGVIRHDRSDSILHGETGMQDVALPSTSGIGVGNNNEASRQRRRKSTLARVASVRSVASAPTIAGTDTVSSAAQEMDDPMESFSPVTDNSQGGAVLHDEVPDIIANKIQKHHELWYHLAYGRPRDRRVSGGYGLQSARLGGKPLPRPNRKRSEVSGLTHIASWKSRPRLWSDIGSPDANATPGHRPITSIDYGNADEVVLSHTQEADEDSLIAEDALPAGSPEFMLHPYDKRKVRPETL